MTMKLAKKPDVLHYTVMSRLSIYQLFVQHFGNFKEEQISDGTLKQNGCGKFADITDEALQSIADMGINTVWYTGVLEHATSTEFPGVKADPDSILKGKAGSPYAVKDYFDLAPSLATNPDERQQEFSDLIARTHAANLKCLIDFVPNHVARSYQSDVYPELDFGSQDDTSQFFHPNNDFYYLEDAEELTLPNGETFLAEKGAPRVSGNNVISASPSYNDWYETVKLNYGYDFRDRESMSQLNDIVDSDVPSVWLKMRKILLYWADKGIDGVRCDMAHMVPTQFWKWVISQVRQTYPDFIFIAEAYQNDPMGCLPNWSLTDLTAARFNAYYDQDFYHQVKAVVEGDASVESLNAVFFDEARQNHGIRYIENHDEVRVANPSYFGSDHQNLAAMATVLLAGYGPVMIYNGQEVGEPAVGATGFSGNDGRTSIFDYTALPTLQKWTNKGAYDGAQLTPEQRMMRSKYVALLRVSNQQIFQSGDTYGLNYLNPHLSDQRAFVFLRYCSNISFSLVITCFAKNVPDQLSVMISEGALQHMGFAQKTFSADSIMNGDKIQQHHTENGDIWIDVTMTESVNIISFVPEDA